MNHQRPDPETAVDRPAPRRWRIARRFVVPLGIAGCLAVAVARCPQLLASPRFWAEEGRDYFAYAFAHGPLAGLLASHLGYYALVTNASAALASVVPLEHAPLVTTAIALLVQLAVSALVLTSVSSLWCGGAATLAIALAVQLLAPAEVWLTSLAAQYWLCIATFVILVGEPARPTATAAWGRRVALAVAGLTGVQSCLLTPFFAWRAVRTRSREAWIHTGILAAASALQAAVFVRELLAADPHLAERFAGSGFSAWNWLLDTFAAPFLGSDPLAALALGQVPALVWILVATCVGASLALAGIGLATRERRIAWGAFLAVAFLSVVLSIRMEGSPRYSFAPNVMLIALVAGFATGATRLPLRWAAVALVVVALVMNARTMRDRVYHDDALPRWHDEVARWRADPSYRPRIWPQFDDQSWDVTLRR